MIVCSSCIGKAKNAKENGEKCYNDTVIQFWSDSLNIKLFKLVSEFEKVEIIHKHIGKEENLPYKYRENYPLDKVTSGGDVFRIKSPRILYTHDTIQVRVNDLLIYNINDFRNGAKYGGNRFLGCHFYFCITNGIENPYMGENTIYLTNSM